MTRRAVAVGAACALLTLAGCSTAAPLDPDVVAVIPPQNSGMDALLEGELAIDETCVTIATESGGVLPVFPRPMVAWDGGDLVIDGERYGDGDPVRLGGGFIREPENDRELSADIHIPDGCPTGSVFLVAG